jgi:hypothetical protein
MFKKCYQTKNKIPNVVNKFLKNKIKIWWLFQENKNIMTKYSLIIIIIIIIIVRSLGEIFYDCLKGRHNIYIISGIMKMSIAICMIYEEDV